MGYMFIEEWSFVDSIYMAIIGISTVGFAEVHPLTTNGKIFTVIYLITGLATFLYTIAELGERIVTQGLRGWFSKLRKERDLKHIKDHFIICGAGRVGVSLGEYFSKLKHPFIIIDNDEVAITECQERGWQWLQADATDDQVLITAGLERAKGVAAVLGSDSENVYITLSTRLLNPKIQITSRASDEITVKKLKKAGANRVVSLYKTGATKMGQLMTNAFFKDFTELFSEDGNEIDMAEFGASDIPHLSGRTIDASGMREQGLVVIAIRGNNGKLEFLPSGDSFIKKDSSLIAIGTSKDIQNFCVTASQN